jgi:hypothetical protein
LGGSATLTGRKSGSISRIEPHGARLAARFRTRGLDVSDVVQHRSRGHEVEAAGIDRAGDDVALSHVEPRRPHVDERQVEIDGDRLAAGPDALREPGGDRAVAAADLERPSARTHAEGLDVPAVHRVEQSRHQRQPDALTLEVVVEDVLGHR